MKESAIKTSKSVDLIGAIVSGLCVGFILAWTRSSGDEFDTNAFIEIILQAVCSYSLVALLLPQWKGRPLVKIPNWILIAVLGSMITFLSVNIISDVVSIWRFRESSVVGYASGTIQEEIIRIIGSTIIDSLIALPIMGTLHYTAQRIKARRRPTTMKTEGGATVLLTMRRGTSRTTDNKASATMRRDNRATLRGRLAAAVRRASVMIRWWLGRQSSRPRT